jgi:hypothetical protein
MPAILVWWCTTPALVVDVIVLQPVKLLVISSWRVVDEHRGVIKKISFWLSFMTMCLFMLFNGN